MHQATNGLAKKTPGISGLQEREARSVVYLPDAPPTGVKTSRRLHGPLLGPAVRAFGFWRSPAISCVSARSAASVAALPILMSFNFLGELKVGAPSSTARDIRSRRPERPLARLGIIALDCLNLNTTPRGCSLRWPSDRKRYNWTVTVSVGGHLDGAAVVEPRSDAPMLRETTRCLSIAGYLTLPFAAIPMSCGGDNLLQDARDSPLDASRRVI